MSVYIVTLAEAKADLEIEDSVDDAVLTEWLEGLQGRLDGFCRRKFLYAENEEEIFDGGERFLYVDHFPIESIASIYIAADQDWTNGTLLDPDDADYLYNVKRGKISYGTGSYLWPTGWQSIRVTYTGGFVKSDGSACTGVDAAELDALRRAMFMQAGFEWRNRKILGVGQLSASGGSIQTTPGVALSLKGMTLLPEVEQTLLPFKRFV